MKVSLSHIRYYQNLYQWSGDPAPNGVDALVETIGAQLGAVEEVIAVGKRYEGVLIVKVMSCDDHPNADRLHVCKIDDGGKAENVERDENGFVQVVCGAPNVREGLTVAWLPPGSTVPNTYDTDPFVLEARALRGVVSNGMLASPKELALGDSHEGILEIEDESIQPGTYFVDAYGLRDDVVIDMENKMFTHRPDCFGMLGVAREIAGIQQQAFKSPEWYRADARIEDVDGPLRVEVRNEIPELVPRFVAIPMSDIKVGPSPVWLQVNLSRLGLRPINNVVDLTNYYMILTGQPIHAYDYDKVKALSGADHAVMTIRHPNEGETITLLNGKTIEPRNDSMMVATDKQLICVGGAIGGAETEVDENTKNIIIEAANWDMYTIRKTSMTHGIFTDAVTRFNKGQSPLQNLAVVSQIVEAAGRWAEGKVAGRLVDDNHLSEDVLSRQSIHPEVNLSRQFINERLGFDLSTDEISQLLRNVEFDVKTHDEDLTVKAPFWRTDIAIAEDVVEEVGRLYGFDHLPLELPKRDLTPTPKDAVVETKAEIREVLARAGANELLTYTFVHGNLLEKAGQDKENAFQVSNALSPDLQYFRMSLTPSLLDKVHPNIKAGYDEFVIFEMNKTHGKHYGQDQEGLPKEVEMLSLVVAASDKKAQAKTGAAYYEAKKYLEYLANQFRLELEYVPFAEAPEYPVTQPYDYKRSALIKAKGTDVVLGVVGEYRKAVSKGFKLPTYTAGFDMDVEHIVKAADIRLTSYQQLPRFPKVEQDICLRVDDSMTYQELKEFVEDHLESNHPDQALYSISPVDIYKREGDDKKQITFRLSIASFERTLTDEEVNSMLEAVAAKASEAFGAQRI
jgi:phenylalanyl-tRNA synthetase beta chain